MRQLSNRSSGFAVWLPGPGDFAALHAADMPQKDGLCGPFWVALALRALGVSGPDGGVVGDDLVARSAGSKLAMGDPYPWLPEGAHPRTDYTLDHPIVEADQSGTSIPGLLRAVETVAGGALVALPVSGSWSEEMIGALFKAASCDSGALLIANVRTGAFIGSHARPAALIKAATGDDANLPGPDWDVGHFVNPLLWLEGPRGALVLIRDTYPSLGAEGYHWQTAASLAAALSRGDGKEGGVLVLCEPAADVGIREQLPAAGLRIGPWDNGTPDDIGGIQT